MKLTSLTILILALSFFHKVHSQSSPAKFGKIDIADLQSTVCPIDSNAHAYYLFDVGDTDFRYDMTGGKGFQLYFNRHLRIKILDKEGFSWGDIYIALYHKGNSEEEVTEMKAFTYNLENDKIIKTKVERSDQLSEESSKNIKTVKFAMPNIKEGSIIELEYTIKSDFLFNLQEWYFQRSIPTLYSAYNVSIPEYFNYNQAQHGYYPIQNTVTTKNKSITFTYKERSGNYTVTTETYTNKVDYRENCYHYLATNIPAFPDERFLKTKDNYLSRVKFELQSTKFPNEPFKTFTTTWEEVDKELAEDYNFGKELNKTGHLDDDVKLLKTTGLQGEALLNLALGHIKKQISWDGRNNKYLTSTLSKAYKTGQGNAADINLNLVVLLKELGFKSYPVILSTQQNGIIHPSHPSLTSFNYVIAMAEYDGNTYLMDATDPHSMLNLLPVRCLNDKGRIIGEPVEKWINLMNYKTFIAMASYEMILDDNLSLVGKVKKQLAEYGAYEYRSNIKKSDDTEKTTKKLEEHPGCTIDSIKITGLDSLSNNLGMTYNLYKTDGTNASGGMVYFTPDIDPFFDENPFKLEKREFPVEFNYPYRIQQVYTYKIPDNYEITEIPKPVAIKLPNGNGNFYFQTSQLGNTISVSSMISIRNSLFLPNEYQLLKEFFQSIVDKHNEFILLKSI
jgi:hypothetical protein